MAAGNGIEAKSDLAGKVVAVQKESSALAALNDEENAENIALRDSFAELIEYADYNTAFLDLKAGRIDALVGDKTFIEYILANQD